MPLNWISLLAKSPWKRHLVSQLGHPRGWLGSAIAEQMNASNLGMSRHGIAALGLQPGQTVWELGFGGGVALPLLLEAVGPQGKVLGLDRAKTMLKAAKRRFAGELATGRLELHPCELPVLPQGLPEPQGILAVNVVYFWTEPAACVKALAGALAPGGVLALVLRPPEVAKFTGMDKAGFNTVEPELVADWMRAAGLGQVELKAAKEGRFQMYAVRGVKL